MSIPCRQSRVWLSRTVQSWSRPSCRFRSTTSAINQGLRATQKANGERPRGRDRGRLGQRDGGFRRDGPAFNRSNTALNENARSARPERRFADPASQPKLRGSGLRRDGPAFERSNATSRDVSQSTRPGRDPSEATRPVRPASRGPEDEHWRNKVGSKKMKIKKFTSEGERPGSDDDFWSPQEADRAFNEFQNSPRRTGGRDRSVKVPLRSNDRNDRNRSMGRPPVERPSRSYETVNSDRSAGSVSKPARDRGGWTIQRHGARNPPPDIEASGKQHPELFKIIQQLSRPLKNLGPASHSQRYGEDKLRMHLADHQQTIVSLLDRINEKMATGEWTKRYVRKALNDSEERLHFWEKEDEKGRNKTGLWFDYENARMALMVQGEVIEAKQSKASQSEGEPKSERMFSIIQPERTSPKKHTQLDENENDDIPLSIPYTTAASIFLYGTNTVLACLKAKRRRVYKLYLRSSFPSSDPIVHELSNLAREAGIRIQSNQDIKLLDKLSDGRPHNGVVLETSVLPAPPVLAVGTSEDGSAGIPLALASQSAEDTGVNGSPEMIPFTNHVAGRNHLIVLLDGITDPGNLGTILRTCYFYSVTAVAIATNTCAPLNSPVVAKASSGACEALPILALPKPSGFVFESARAGWKVYASVAPGDEVAAASSSYKHGKVAAGAAARPAKRSSSTLSMSQLIAHAPLTKEPCILMLGAEGDGLRDILKRRADYFVSIDPPRRTNGAVDVGVDSLNVSAAAGVLVDAFMRTPSSAEVNTTASPSERPATVKNALRREGKASG